MNSKLKPIVLFDMDGTLSPARQPIIEGMLEKLIMLSAVSEIGIVTGSGIAYIKQQCESIIDNISNFNSKLTLFPCNGTQVYKINSLSNIKCIFSENMREHIGSSFNEILTLVLKEQTEFMITVDKSDLSKEINLSGTFLQYRNSMLNWCPIGRDASDTDREAFVIADKKYKIREKLAETLNTYRVGRGIPIQFALGGATSIDIYPEGWDKTFVLKHINADQRDVYFIGDRCHEGGNDKTIYEKILPRGTAYETISPQHTLQLVDKIQENILN